MFDTLKSQSIRDGKRPHEVGQYPPVRHPPGKRRTKKEMEWERSRPPLKGRILSGNCPVRSQRPGHYLRSSDIVGIVWRVNRSVEWSLQEDLGLFQGKVVSSTWRSAQSPNSSRRLVIRVLDHRLKAYLLQLRNTCSAIRSFRSCRPFSGFSGRHKKERARRTVTLSYVV